MKAWHNYCMIERRCQQCDKSFFITPSRIKHGEGKYCSRECADEAKRGMHFSLKTEFKKGQPSPRKGNKTGKPSPMRGKKTGKPSPMKGKKTGKPAWNSGKKGLQIAWNKGKKGVYSEETRRKMGEAKKGKPSHMKGKHHTEEAKRKNSEAHKGKPSPMKGKKTGKHAWNRNKIEMQCLQCGKNFLTTPFRIKDKRGKFCSKKCKNASQLGKLTWNKGKIGIYSNETRIKMGKANIGKLAWNSGKTGIFSEEILDILRASRAKQRLPTKDSMQEILIREELDKRGIKYETDYSIKTKGFLTKPDIALPEIKLAVYLDGCYWHMCPICFKDKKLTNQQITNKPISEKREFIKSLGWKLIMFWEHEVLQNPAEVANKIIEEAVKSRSKI